jgi:non-heme chloroperoxidase
MGTITTTDGTEIFYKDWGSGQPVVFSHGWPLSADDWDTQMLFFLQHGYRVVPLCQDQVRHQGQPLLVELEG